MFLAVAVGVLVLEALVLLALLVLLDLRGLKVSLGRLALKVFRVSLV
jgi:hypothetical protein